MKTCKERTDNILAKANTIRKKRTRSRLIATSVTFCLVLALCLTMFLPVYSDSFDASRYEKSPYYQVICNLGPKFVRNLPYKNNFERLMYTFSPNKDYDDGSDSPDGNNPTAPGLDGDPQSNPDVTDNQVSGVMEGDLFKRSSDHIFYLDTVNDDPLHEAAHLTLRVYTTEQEDSANVCNFYIYPEEGFTLRSYHDEHEMFISEDGATLTVISNVKDAENNLFSSITTIDVTDATAPRIVTTDYVSGYYHTARLTDGLLLVFTKWQTDNDPDFFKPEQFIPQTGKAGSLRCIDASDIAIPEQCDSQYYTVTTAIDTKTGAIVDTSAVLDSANAVYVDNDNYYVSCAYKKYLVKNGDDFSYSLTSNIFAYSFDSHGITQQNSFTVPGTVLNQYSLDEKDGLLRVVTTTEKNSYISYSFSSDKSASLFVIDTSTADIVCSVENFAPDGESVRSVRFDGDKVYVCTAIQVTDPVFEIDISDLSAPVVKDTGTIPGFSFALKKFYGDTLLGIGISEGMTAKLELYKTVEDRVVSVASYELEGEFSRNYKSYLIDAENNLIGLGFDSYSSYSNISYMLFGYYFGQLVPIQIVELNERYGEDNIRSAYIDGYVYVFLHDQFKILKVGQDLTYTEQH